MRHPSFLFDPAKYWLDAYDLTDAQHGIYLRLLMVMWAAPRCKIPHDDAWIASKMTRSVEAFEIEVKPILLRFCRTDGNSWWQKTLLAEFERQERLRSRSTAGGKALAEKKKTSCQTPARDSKQAPASKLQPDRFPLVLSSTTSSSKNLFEQEERDSVGTPIIEIPVVGNLSFPVSQKMLLEFSVAYPAVDILQELRAMRAWSLSNPTLRKTIKGVPRFVNSWLAKTQNRARGNENGRRPTALDNFLAGGASLIEDLERGAENGPAESPADFQASDAAGNDVFQPRLHGRTSQGGHS